MASPVVSRRSPRIGAFFDMDKPLMAENSGSLYMRYRYARGEISGMELLKGLGAYIQYKVGMLDIRHWTKNMMLQFKDSTALELESQARDWFDELVAPTIYPEAEELVRKHQAQDHIVVVVSGATKFVVQPLAERLKIEHMLYTRLEVEGGVFTGRVIEPICFEEGQIYWLQQLLVDHDIALAQSWFYTPSLTAMPPRDHCGHPVAVNPGPLLYRTAVKRRWPVRFFEPPA